MEVGRRLVVFNSQLAYFIVTNCEPQLHIFLQFGCFFFCRRCRFFPFFRFYVYNAIFSNVEYMSRYPVGMQQKISSLPNRGAYSSSSTHIHNANASLLAGERASGISSSTCNVSSSSRHNINKKRPISPEQVLRLFGTTTSSSSAPSNYNYSNGIARDRGRRSPASSPPSTSHHMNRVSRV